VDDPRARHDQCRILADRLIVEYAGAVPPGQVLAAVLRAHLGLTRHVDLSDSARMAMCELAARRALTERVAGRPASSLAG